MTPERELLERAEDALHSTALRLIAASPYLTKPFTDAPDLSPWTHTIAPQARRAHDLALEIRKHLGLPHRWATSGHGTPPPEIEAVVAEAVAAERERIRQLAIDHEACWGHEFAYPFADLLTGETP
jgi:hypothetical protein